MDGVFARSARKLLVIRRFGRYTGRMRSGRAIASSVAIPPVIGAMVIGAILIGAILIGLGGGCGGSSSKPSDGAQPAHTAAQVRATAAARARVAVARRRLAAARRVALAERRAAAQRLALAAAVRRRIQAARTHPTSTTVAPGATQPTTPAAPTTPDASTPARDLAAIQAVVDKLNAAFAKSVAAGIVSSEKANYWVGAGVYTAAACGAFEARAGQGVVAERLVLHPESFVATPGWVDPVVRSVPAGRIYGIRVDEIQTLASTGQQRSQTAGIHATVLPDGRARLLLRCA
jgi:hypothetical protein